MTTTTTAAKTRLLRRRRLLLLGRTHSQKQHQKMHRKCKISTWRKSMRNLKKPVSKENYRKDATLWRSGILLWEKMLTKQLKSTNKTVKEETLDRAAFTSDS